MSSNFTPTSAELALVNQIFAHADPQKIGILTGDVAVRVFGGAKLQPAVLGEIWSIADDDNNGFLTKKGVAIAVRLMGWAQKGEKVSQALLGKPGSLPTIEGVQAPLLPQGTGMSIPKSPPPGLPVLTPQDKAKFNRLFQSNGPVNGLLSGDKARDMFVKSKLSVDKLSQIWTLCDTQDRGALDSTDFTIAMYLIQALMSGQLSFIPTTLPPGLYEQAGGGGIVAHATGSSAHLGSPGAPTFPAPKQQPLHGTFTGQTSSAPALPTRRPGQAGQVPVVPPFPGVAPQATGQWDVTAAEKAGADRFFDTLDQQKRGFIEGDVAVPFMLQSKLSEDILAHVWDLADINKDGRLTRDGFAVAMHLIQGKLSGKEVPATLPLSLIPPSMRSNGTAAPFAAPPSIQHSEALRDLLWDDSPPTSAVNTQPQNNVLQPQSTGTHPASFTTVPLSVSPRPPQMLEDPFGASASHNSFNADLLGDDDDTHASPPLHDQSAEIGNVQNQLNSTNRSHQTVKAERESLETTLANQAAQLSALQTQLASAKASFETETTLVNTLRDRHAAQTAEMQKVREELIRSESDLSALRVEKAEIEGAFLRDKEEVRDLNRRMAEATTQIAAFKQEVEKVKKDAKQQKGLLAIARKQLATKESEKAKADQELEEATDDLSDTIKEREEAEAEVEKTLSTLSQANFERAKSPADSLALAAAQPLPITPDLTGGPMSPASVKSNNPFERLAMSSGASTPRSQSPFRSFSSTPLPPGLSSPPGLPAPASTVSAHDDPFGFSQAFGSEAQQESEDVPDNDAVDLGAATPRPDAASGDFGDVVASPTTDELFSTPPNSTTPVNQGEDAARFPSLDTAASHFPAIDDIAEPSAEGRRKETDLSTDLRELDVDETDSDSDSDEESQEEASQDHADHTAETPSTNDESAPSQTPVSFDDIFGSSNDAPAATSSQATAPQTDSATPVQNGSPTVDAFGAPLIKPSATPNFAQDSGFPPATQPGNVVSSGLNSFDEAFGKTSSSGPAQPASTFSFDSQFEDNFDFSSAAGPGSVFPPAPSSGAAPVNGSVATGQNVAAPANGTQDLFSQPANGAPPAAPKAAPAQAAPVSFDDAFSSDPRSAQPSAPPPEKTVANQSSAATFSFEEAFGGLESSQALKLDNSFSSRSSKAFTSLSSPPSEIGKPFPSVSPPTSPRGPSSPRVTSIRSASPQPRATSPPPRVASPKMQRPSTSSSTKEVPHEKPAPPPRHSKLSIRLPFGKKKKQDSVPPVPSSHLAQQLTPVEEPNASPAVEDDVQPVKQLAAMGFSRNQAVAALEAHDYDVQRALNSLLGGQ
ncbi:hypothetical protein HYDPIDRAFT_116899 [Hydnomerulius pinastri MD-312]|uniref:Uncharacterized protein n=1 Tax=Hydnomerulius pinastri MD-312 TaxID=994086 RepID=A0A0C9W389_9AGAM|nr:hypothetical protein HYDPIDRAFT_116899 [Hydnomerulius pinastri MD-312]